MDVEPESLAERIAGYAVSPVLRDEPLMQMDLVAAAEIVADHVALLRAWKVIFEDVPDDTGGSDIDRLKPHLREKFAELLGAAPGMNGWKRRLELKVILTDGE